jgi:hypothetical protein
LKLTQATLKCNTATNETSEQGKVEPKMSMGESGKAGISVGVCFGSEPPAATNSINLCSYFVRRSYTSFGLYG